MIKTVRKQSTWLVVLACAGGLGFAAPVPVDETLPPLERMRQRLTKSSGLIVNARVKLNRGVRDGMERTVAPTLEAAPAPSTPGRLCCHANIKRIRQHYAAMNKDADQLEACYDKKARTLALQQLRVVRGDIELFVRVVGKFENAAEPATTAGYMSGMQRTYLQLEGSMNQLPPCPGKGKGKGK